MLLHSPIQHVNATARCKHQRGNFHHGIALDWNIDHANLRIFGFDLVAAGRFVVHSAALEQDASKDEVIGDRAMLVAAVRGYRESSAHSKLLSYTTHTLVSREGAKRSAAISLIHKRLVQLSMNPSALHHSIDSRSAERRTLRAT